MADPDMPIDLWSPHRLPALGAVVSAHDWPWRPLEGGGSPGGIVVADGRDDPAGAAAVLAASAMHADGPAVLMVLVADPAPAAIDRFVDAGATQVAVMDGDDALAPALRLALRSRERHRDRDRRGGRRPGSRTAERWIASRAPDTPVTVLHVALRRFDLVNAAHGREFGTLLVAAAERRVAAQVDALADDEGLVARVEGPAIVAAVAGPADRAILLAARIEEAMAAPFRINGRQAVLGTRIGIAGVRPGDAPATAIARAAHHPGSDVAVLPLAHPAAADDPDALAADAHLAIGRGEIAIHYQPLVAVDDGRLVGVEALARWDHPRLGALGAGVLLAAAERAGLDLALSEHIQRRVLESAALWPPALAHLRLSLNLTAADLARPSFVETFLAHVDASGFPRSRLTVEITETGLMADVDGAAGLLADLRSAGCRVAIDDFGTGYSSLAYLKALPINYLKIDKALAQDITGSDRDRVVVHGAIDMARSLGIDVIAEGVETEQQRRLLTEAGCALLQGYLFAEPLTQAALLERVTQAPVPDTALDV